MRYGLLTDQSRKVKAARSFFESLKNRGRAAPTTEEKVLDFVVTEGFHVPREDKQRLLKLRLHDEHMSPYFKTDMNLFHLLMIDENAEASVYLTEQGVLFVFEGLPNNPQPFGSSGHDLR